MKVPNAERAVVDATKLRDYCLSSTHPRGKHKARVFVRVLGITLQHAQDLQLALLTAVREQDAVVGELDQFGQRYILDFSMRGPTGIGLIRSTWIVRPVEDFPRFVSCYVL
jgi:hypothetical protein